MNFTRKEKNKVRTKHLIEPMLNHEPVKYLLCLPAGQCLALKEMLLQGVIDKNTFIIAVEKSKQVAKRIEKFLKANFKKSYVHCGEFSRLNLDGILNGNKLDFVYLDFCGNLKFEYKGWLFNNNHHFAKYCRVCYTFKTINRKKTSEKATKRTYANSVSIEVEKKLQSTVSNLSKGFWGKTTEKSRLNVLVSVNYYIADLFVSFDTQDFDVNQVIMYKDGKHCEMVFIDTVLTGNKKSTKALFNLALYHYFQNIEINTRNKVRLSLGLVTEKPKKRGRPRLAKVNKESIADMLGIKDREDSQTAGRKMVITKYIMKLSLENNITKAQASKRVWGGINRRLTYLENN